MMIWEGSKDPIVNLCNKFRKAVVAAFEVKPELGQKILGAFTADELKEFDQWSQEAVAKSQALLSQESGDQKTIASLDKIVLDMSEKSAECALRVLGKDELRAFVKPEHRTQEVSNKYSERNYPSLAIIFAP